MQENARSINTFANAVETHYPSCITGVIKQGVTAKRLHTFVKSVPNDALGNMASITRKILSVKDKELQKDLYFDIYNIIFEKLPVQTLPDLLVFCKLIGFLALQRCQQPQPPLNLLRQLLYTIPEELRTRELITMLVNELFSISSDPGDQTHLCLQCAALGEDWNCLTEMLCWKALISIMKAEKIVGPEPTAEHLYELISKGEPPGTVRRLEMTILLMSILINRIVLKETGEDAEDCFNQVKSWLYQLPSQFEVVTEDASLYDVDTLSLQTIITHIMVHWPSHEE